MKPIPAAAPAPLPLTRLLVANRGEIACRVMRTAKALGIDTVAVHSAVDRNARHVREADLSVDLGGAKPAESYLLIDKLIAAAQAFSRKTPPSPAPSNRPG